MKYFFTVLNSFNYFPHFAVGNLSEFIIYASHISIKSNNILVFSLSCGVDMGDQYVVIGGQDNLNWDKGIRKVGLYNDDGFVRNLPDLVMGRFYHACAGFQDINGDMVGVILFCSLS